MQKLLIFLILCCLTACGGSNKEYERRSDELYKKWRENMQKKHPNYPVDNDFNYVPPRGYQHPPLIFTPPPGHYIPPYNPYYPPDIDGYHGSHYPTYDSSADNPYYYPLYFD